MSGTADEPCQPVTCASQTPSASANFVPAPVLLPPQPPQVDRGHSQAAVVANLDTASAISAVCRLRAKARLLRRSPPATAWKRGLPQLDLKPLKATPRVSNSLASDSCFEPEKTST